MRGNPEDWERPDCELYGDEDSEAEISRGERTVIGAVLAAILIVSFLGAVYGFSTWGPR